MKKLERKIELGDKARTTLYGALRTIAEAVGSTLGPGGRPFGFDKLGADMRLTPSFSKDGLTVLKSLGFEDQAADAVLHYCKQAASLSVLASGDGTTSTIVLAEAVARAILNNAGANPQATVRRIEREAQEAISAIQKEAITTPTAVRLVALTSTNGDEELTDVVLESIKYTSAFGTILVEKNPASPVRYKIMRQDGYSNCAGYNYNQTLALSADSAAAANKPIEWSNPSVLIFNGNLITSSQIEPILKAWNDSCVKTGLASKLVVIAFEVGDEVANRLLVFNRQAAKHGVSAMIVKPRLTAEVNAGLQIIWDIAAFCGIKEANIVDGGNFRDINENFFGKCGKIVINPMQTMLLGRSPNHWVETRVNQNAAIIEAARSQFDKQITAIRNAELAEGLVKVEVGGGLLPDLQERADRFDDASKAAQSCMVRGALPGCGVSYIRAGKLAGVGPELADALSSIHKSIMANYGAEPYLDPERGQTIKLDGDKVIKGDAEALGVLDSCDTVCAVIKNGVSLGTKIAVLGGYSFRDLNAEVDDYE